MKLTRAISNAIKTMPGCNLSAIAKAADISRTYMGRIANENVIPTLDVIERIAEAIHVNPMEIDGYVMKMAKEIVESDKEMAETVVRVYLSKQEREKREQKKGKKVV